MSTPLLLIYGQGGHKTEMSLMLTCLANANKAKASKIYSKAAEIKVITLGPQPLNSLDGVTQVAHFDGSDVRDKHSRLATMLAIIPHNFLLIFNTLRIYRRYSLAGVISTGPGLAILPMLILRLFGVKTVFVETYCRFSTRSMTAKVMSKIAHRFLVQNKPQMDLYDNAEYCGRL